MEVCTEQDLSKTSSALIHFHLMNLFHHLLQWSGIQQTKIDTIKEQSLNLCSESWLYILYVIFTKELTENFCNFVHNLTNSFLNFCLLITTYCNNLVQEIIISSSFPENTSVVFILFIIVTTAFITTFLWKYVLWRTSSSGSSINGHSKRGYDCFINESGSWPHNSHEPLQLTPLIENMRQERKITEKSLSQRGYYGFSFLIQWIFLIVITAVLLSIPWEFLRLYQKAVASHAAHVVKGLPPHCTQTSMSWLESFQFLLRWHFSWSHSQDSCQDYYYASLVDPLWEVNPLLVVSSVFTQGILHPLEMASSSLGRSVRVFFSEIPMQWQPFIMLFAVVMGIVLLLMTCRYRLSVPLFLRIEPKTPVKSPSETDKLKERRRDSKFGDITETDNFCLSYDGGEHVKVDDKSIYNHNYSDKNRYLSRTLSSTPKYPVSNSGDLKASAAKSSKQNLLDGFSANDSSVNGKDKEKNSKKSQKAAKKGQSSRRR